MSTIEEKIWCRRCDKEIKPTEKVYTFVIRHSYFDFSRDPYCLSCKGIVETMQENDSIPKYGYGSGYFTEGYKKKEK